MKIAYLITSIEAMGPNIFTYNLIEGLKCYEKFECEVFYFKDQSLYEDLPKLSFYCKTTKLKFTRKHDFSSFDLIHTTSALPDMYVVYHRLYKDKPCITSMHNFMEGDLLQRKNFFVGHLEVAIWKYCVKKFRNIIVSSSIMKDYYVKKIGKRSVYTTIPYGIPDVVFDNINNTTKNVLEEVRKKYAVLVGCGTLIKRKCFHLLVSYLSHNDKAAVVLIGGGVCEDELKNLSINLGVNDRVVFLGFREKSSNYYPFFDVFCMSSNSEGFGLAMLEGMAAGLPVVCSDLPIYKDYFGNNEVGMFEPENQNDFNKAVDRVLENRVYFSKQSRTLFEEKFSLSAMAEKHMKLYNNILYKEEKLF